MSRRQHLEAKTVAQLRVEARQLGHSGVSRLRKAELIDLLLRQREERAEAVPRDAKEQRSAIGRLLQAVAVVGLLIGLVVAMLGPLVAVRGSRRLREGLVAASATAEGLAETVGASERSLRSAGASLEAARQGMQSVEGSLEGSDPLLGSLSDLLGDELVSTLETTQASLKSAEQGAAAMDQVLRGLRFLGLEYDPNQPLDRSLAEAAASLEPVPPALEKVESELGETRVDLKGIRVELRALDRELERLSKDLEATADSLGKQAATLERAAGRLDRWAERSSLLGWIAAAGSSIFGLWLCVLHLMMFEGGRRWGAGAVAGD